MNDRSARKLKPRCEHCGRALPSWTNAAIIEALRAWAGRHGRTPSRDDWRRATAFHPHCSTVVDQFGTWTAAIDAAGLVRLPHPKSRPQWTRDTVIAAMRAWHRDHGQAPSAKEWAHPTEEHPSYAVVVHRFGAWRAAVALAGLPLRTPRGIRTKVAA